MSDIVLKTPEPNERQVLPGTNLELEISGFTTDGYGPDLTTLNVQVNGIRAIDQGVFQRPSAVLSDTAPGAVGSPPDSTTRFYELDSNPFVVGDKVDVSTSEGEFTTTTIIGIQNGIIELNDAVPIPQPEDRPDSFQIDVESTSRSFLGNIGSPVSGTAAITINPLQDFAINKVVFVVVEVQELVTSGDLKRVRRVFTFRTTDILPPRIVDFPHFIHFSNLSFKVVDLLGNKVLKNTLNLYLDDNKAIDNGVITSDYSGALSFRGNSELDVFLRPKQEFDHNQEIDVQVQVTDGYANQTTFNRPITNRAIIPRVEFIQIDPKEETILDPTSDSITIDLRVDEPLDKSFINVSYTVDGTIHEAIKIGEFQGSHSGFLRGTRNITIHIDNLEATTFNKEVEVNLTLQEVTDLGDIPPGVGPFYTKSFNFVTISATLAPAIEALFPEPNGTVSPSTQIRFTAVSQVQGAKMDPSATTVAIENTLVIDQGLFVNGYTGTLLSKQGSNAHALNAIIIPPEDLPIGSTVDVEIEVGDIAGNIGNRTHSFSITNTNLPVVTMNPPGGTFKELTRIGIEADQSAMIHYTLDGSVPNPGNISTFSQASPISNVPIFREGVTQVKAFAVNNSGIEGDFVTEIYELNPFIPEVEIISPEDGTLISKNTAAVTYNINLQRGFLTQVEFVVNDGVPQDVQNTLANSTVSIAGLRTGTNTIEIRATDNAGSIGTSSITINVQASQILDFSLQYAPLRCPTFPRRPVVEQAVFNDFIDTSTVAIIGLGSRREVLVDFGLGEGLDGEPIDFSASNEPDSRHFSLRSFPVREETLRVLLFRKNRELELDPEDYIFEPSTGRLVLDHPVESGETLTVEYIADPDVNMPTLFQPNETNQLFRKHGQPSSENTLSLAAQIAFENGARRVLAVQGEDPSIDANWSQSFIALRNSECYWVTPVVRNEDINLYPSIIAAAFNHSERMSKIINRKERIVAAWHLPDASNDFKQKRIFLTNVDLDPRVIRVVRGEGTELNGSFVAAAISGKGSGLPVATPLTGKTLTGFTMETRQRSPKLDLLRKVKKGLLPVLARSSGGEIFRGRTAYVGITDPVKEELSVQRTVDWLSKNLRRRLENRFKGSLLTPNATNFIELAVSEFLSNQEGRKISRGLVTNVEIDSRDPRQVNIDVTIFPLFPLNDINITFTLTATL